MMPHRWGGRRAVRKRVAKGCKRGTSCEESLVIFPQYTNWSLFQGPGVEQ